MTFFRTPRFSFVPGPRADSLHLLLQPAEKHDDQIHWRNILKIQIIYVLHIVYIIGYN